MIRNKLRIMIKSKHSFLDLDCMSFQIVSFTLNTPITTETLVASVAAANPAFFSHNDVSKLRFIRDQQNCLLEL